MQCEQTCEHVATVCTSSSASANGPQVGDTGPEITTKMAVRPHNACVKIPSDSAHAEHITGQDKSANSVRISIAQSNDVLLGIEWINSCHGSEELLSREIIDGNVAQES